MFSRAFEHGYPTASRGCAALAGEAAGGPFAKNKTARLFSRGSLNPAAP
jgi:hypothetical protein